jgi:serpin B
MKRFLILYAFTALIAVMCSRAAEFDLAATATNDLAVDLHRQLATGNENLCVSPYSIESALAMTFAGADGETRSEMARVLHFPSDASAVPASFASLQHSLEEMSAQTANLLNKQKIRRGDRTDHTEYRQSALPKKDTIFAAFLALVKQNYGRHLNNDFITDASGATQHINKWSLINP